MLPALLKTHYGIDAVRIEPVAGGADPNAETFAVEDRTGARWFVKRRVGFDPGIALCSELYRAGNEIVLAPCLTLSGEVSAEDEGRHVLVYPFLEGQNAHDRPLSPDQWTELGAALRQIHETPVTAPIQRETFRVEGEDLSIAGELGLDEALVERVFRRTRELGDECRLRELPLVPCHSDLHIWNTFVTHDGQIRIVDWDAPRLAPRECDFLFFCGRGITGHGPEVEEAFFRGYGPFPVDPRLLTYYRYARAMEDIVSFAREIRDGDDGARRYLAGIFKPGQIVETAIASDR